METEPLGVPEQPCYLNGAAKIATSLSPVELHRELASIENDLGRTRDVSWGPRTIDLDILLYGDLVENSSELIIPHKWMHLRSFVMKPMCELDSELVHPLMGKTMSELAGRIGKNDFVIDESRPQVISVSGLIGVGKTTLASKLCEIFNSPLIAAAYDTNPYIADVYAGRDDLALKSQLYFLESRLEQLGQDSLETGKIVVTDYVFDKDRLFAKMTLNSEQMSAYDKRYAHVAKAVAGPVLVVYLTDSAERCVDRIHGRNRPYEQQITPESLASFAAEYDKLFGEWGGCPVIRLDTSEFDCMNADHVEHLADEIRQYVYVDKAN